MPAQAEGAFEVGFSREVRLSSSSGRLFLVLARTNQPEPRLSLGRTGRGQLTGFALDLTNARAGESYRFESNAFGFPFTNISQVPAGDYFCQSVYDCNRDIRSASAPGNLYSEAIGVHLPVPTGNSVRLELTHRIPEEKPPADTENVKFVNLKSELLSAFHRRPMFFRAAIVLPHSFYYKALQPFSMWVRIGGLNTRCTTVTNLTKPGSDFEKLWSAKDAPQFILVQLDGTGPFGDSYFVNSANNGPFGDALVKELIPDIEKQFGIGKYTHRRVSSGVSTGGWVSLALQIFYPDTFCGAWAACPDPVDFRALEAINIYEDKNAYVKAAGEERGSERDSKGNIRLTVRQEAGAERFLGQHNHLAFSGQQWGEWMAAFSPRDEIGTPQVLWDQVTGAINHACADKWKKYDLHLVLAQDWPRLAPKLRGKLHISAGERDQYYLNNAVHLLDEFLKKQEPSIEADITYGQDKGHGWSSLSTKEMLRQMQEAVNRP